MISSLYWWSLEVSTVRAVATDCIVSVCFVLPVDTTTHEPLHTAWWHFFARHVPWQPHEPYFHGHGSSVKSNGQYLALMMVLLLCSAAVSDEICWWCQLMLVGHWPVQQLSLAPCTAGLLLNAASTQTLWTIQHKTTSTLLNVSGVRLIVWEYWKLQSRLATGAFTRRVNCLDLLTSEKNDENLLQVYDTVPDRNTELSDSAKSKVKLAL